MEDYEIGELENDIHEICELNDILDEFYRKGGKLDTYPPTHNAVGDDIYPKYRCNSKCIMYIPPYMNGLPQHKKAGFWKYQRVLRNAPSVSKSFSTKKYGFEGAFARALRAKKRHGYALID